MPIYIIRPRISTTQSLSLANRSLASTDRESQLSEVVGARSQDPNHREIRNWLKKAKGATLMTEHESDTPVTGATLAEISDAQAAKLSSDIPDSLVLRGDQPLPLIEPDRLLATSKPMLAAADRWHLGTIGLESSGKRTVKETGSGVKVAVLDTGIDATHLELVGQVVGAVEFNPSTMASAPLNPSRDDHGHGTHVAGLLAGNTMGVAPGAKLLSGLMLPQGRGTIANFILALEWAARQQDVQIINMSAGISPYDGGMRGIIADLLAIGVLPVIAIGNEGRNRTRSPGNYSEVLSVGATNNLDRVSSFSSGAMMTVDNHQYPVPRLVAPGEQIYSCVKAGGYEAWNGTSMATPIVSGLAALIMERQPKIQVLELIDVLIRACRSLGEPADRQGQGLVQVPATLLPAPPVASRGTTKKAKTAPKAKTTAKTKAEGRTTAKTTAGAKTKTGAASRSKRKSSPKKSG
jgi:subtilisin family serine protease